MEQVAVIFFFRYFDIVDNPSDQIDDLPFGEAVALKTGSVAINISRHCIEFFCFRHDLNKPHRILEIYPGGEIQVVLNQEFPVVDKPDPSKVKLKNFEFFNTFMIKLIPGKITIPAVYYLIQRFIVFDKLSSGRQNIMVLRCPIHVL